MKTLLFALLLLMSFGALAHAQEGYPPPPVRNCPGDIGCPGNVPLNCPGDCACPGRDCGATVPPEPAAVSRFVRVLVADDNGPCENGIMWCSAGYWAACVDGCPTLNCPGDCGCPGRPPCAEARLNFSPIKRYTPIDQQRIVLLALVASRKL